MTIYFLVIFKIRKVLKDREYHYSVEEEYRTRHINHAANQLNQNEKTEKIGRFQEYSEKYERK